MGSFRDLVNDMKATFLDDLDSIASPELRKLFEPARRAVERGGVDRKKPRLSTAKKSKLSKSAIARAARSAFGGVVAEVDAEVKRVKRAKPTRRAKSKRSIGPTTED